MAKRAQTRAGATWWAIAVAVVAVGVLLWWLSARRAEAPGLPASQPGARALSEEPAGGSRGHDADHDHGEITGEEKADLDRIIRERGGAGAGR